MGRIMTRNFLYYLFSVIFLASLVLSGCHAGTTVTPAPNPTADDTPPVISAENIDRLSIVDHVGKGFFYGADLSADGKTLAVAMSTGVYLFDTTTGENTKYINMTITGEKIPGLGTDLVSFSPDGKLLAIVSEYIYIWDLQKNSFIGNFESDSHDIVRILFTPNSKNILVQKSINDPDCSISATQYELWSISTWNSLSSQTVCYGQPQFLADGNILLVEKIATLNGGQTQAIIIDSNTGEKLSEIKVGNKFSSFNNDFSKRAEVLDSLEGTTTIYNLDSYTAKTTIDGDGEYLPSSNSRLFVIANDEWKIVEDDGKLVCKFDESLRNLGFGNWSITEIMNTKKVIWNQLENSLSIYDMSTCEKSKPTILLPYFESDLKFDKDGSFIVDNYAGFHFYSPELNNNHYSLISRGSVALSQSKVISLTEGAPSTISIMNLSSNEIKRSFETGKFYGFLNEGIQINDDGRMIALSNGLAIWDLDTEKLLLTFDNYSGETKFLPDGKSIAIATSGAMLVMDIQTGNLIYTVPFSKYENTGFAFSDEWKYMAIELNDHIEVWDIKGNVVSVLEDYAPGFSYPDKDSFASINCYPSGLIGQKKYFQRYSTLKPYFKVVFSPDNQILIASKCFAGQYILRVWNIESGNIIRDIQMPFTIDDFSFNPDGKSLYTIADGLIYIWQITETE
jgi:hypothetical protein